MVPFVVPIEPLAGEKSPFVKARFIFVTNKVAPWDRVRLV
jgi:hypothetical protein